jgi:hypothetical protein
MVSSALVNRQPHRINKRIIFLDAEAASKNLGRLKVAIPRLQLQLWGANPFHCMRMWLGEILRIFQQHLQCQSGAVLFEAITLDQLLTRAVIIQSVKKLCGVANGGAIVAP